MIYCFSPFKIKSQAIIKRHPKQKNQITSYIWVDGCSYGLDQTDKYATTSYGLSGALKTPNISVQEGIRNVNEWH